MKKLQKELKLKEMTDEGAWISSLSDTEVLEYLHKTLSNVENTMGIKVNFGIDMASSSFWDGKYYVYKNIVKDKGSKTKHGSADRIR